MFLLLHHIVAIILEALHFYSPQILHIVKISLSKSVDRYCFMVIKNTIYITYFTTHLFTHAHMSLKMYVVDFLHYDNKIENSIISYPFTQILSSRIHCFICQIVSWFSFYSTYCLNIYEEECNWAWNFRYYIHKSTLKWMDFFRTGVVHVLYFIYKPFFSNIYNLYVKQYNYISLKFSKGFTI